MNHCVWCKEVVSLDMGWRHLLLPPKSSLLCHDCKMQLQLLPKQVCRKCHRASIKELCTDCLKWQAHYNGNDPLHCNISIFSYNDFLQEVIAKWKYRGDFILGDMFREEIRQKYMQYIQLHIPKDTLLIPIPLSPERMQERAFNQASQLASFLPLQKKNYLTRVHGEKQSKRTRHERMGRTNPFTVHTTLNKTVLLVDDIYTTGSTLRLAADVLRVAGCPKVYALTLARG